MKLSTFILIFSGFIVLANPCLSFPPTYQKKTWTSGESYSESTIGAKNLEYRFKNQITPSERKEIVDLTIKYARKYNVKPAIPLAVAYTESSYRGQEFRKGLVGSKKSGGPFYAPFNIHYSYLKRGWPIDTLEGNVEAGVRCFAGMSEAQALKRLRTYNKKCNPGYVKAVRASIRRYEKEVGK
jgi:hypothetical protein